MNDLIGKPIKKEHIDEYQRLKREVKQSDELIMAYSYQSEVYEKRILALKKLLEKHQEDFDDFYIYKFIDFRDKYLDYLKAEKKHEGCNPNSCNPPCPPRSYKEKYMKQEIRMKRNSDSRNSDSKKK